jgi:hypothetical protein
LDDDPVYFFWIIIYYTKKTEAKKSQLADKRQMTMTLRYYDHARQLFLSS